MLLQIKNLSQDMKALVDGKVVLIKKGHTAIVTVAEYQRLNNVYRGVERERIKEGVKKIATEPVPFIKAKKRRKK